MGIRSVSIGGEVFFISVVVSFGTGGARFTGGPGVGGLSPIISWSPHPVPTRKKWEYNLRSRFIDVVNLNEPDSWGTIGWAGGGLYREFTL